jgi:tetratricopeptide (TPR) repeat protein
MLQGFSPTELSSGRVQRILKLTQQKLGVVYLQTGRADDGLAMLSGVRADLQKAVAADPTDSRAHFDLFALDFNMAEYVDVLGSRELALTLDKEIVREAEALVKLDPGNIQAQGHAALAELRLARLYLYTGNRGEGVALAQRASAELEALVQKNADPDLLQGAADALIETRGDAGLAVAHARVSIEHSPQPASGEYLTLARAHLLAGDLRDAHVAAQKALDLIGGSREAMELNHAAMAHSILSAGSASAAQAAVAPLALQVHSQHGG